MKYFLIPLSALFLLFTTGCELGETTADELIQQGQDALAEANASDSSSSSAPVATSNPAPTGSTGSGGFLWKPVSESNGNLVILLPGSTRGRTRQIVTISGAFGTDSAPMRHENHNGGRPHFYFDKPGSAYGTNITVQAPLTDGSVYSIVVPNGSQRFEN